MAITYSDISGKLQHKAGDVVRTLYPETKADLVKMGDGKTTVQRAIETLQTALGGGNSVNIVANIEARDELKGVKGSIAFVIDATKDATVSSGAATYVYEGKTWVKISEAESLDVVMDWSSLNNKPTSSVADIDNAVLKTHNHNNLVVLDALTDSNGSLAYKGSSIKGSSFQVVTEVKESDPDGEYFVVAS